MTERPPLLAVEDAQARLLTLAPRIATETVPLRKAAGRWAACAVTARRTQPARDLSAMDGYAVRYDDLGGPLRLIGESAAGHPFDGALNAGETVRIFTGAALPAGADAVLIQEEAERDGDAVRRSGAGPARGGNIRLAGIDFRLGDVLIDRGDRLSPARIALAASGGHGDLLVARRIRVAIVASGDELTLPGSPLEDGTLPESNGVMLAAMLADLPVDIIDLGILPDRLETITDAFVGVDADILVTTGGASVGDHDLIRPALAAAGGSIDFWRIALRPGKPMLAGKIGEMLVLGLPGNPVSAFVTGAIFLKPLIAAMAGARDPRPMAYPGILGAPLKENDRRQDYMRATTRAGRVYPADQQDSSLLATLAGADCLIIRAPHAPAAAAGDSVEILPIA
ncbi:gephyrin-like molybdotransferase Glp [Sphingomonas sp. CARO-RG-8B-R24-01]|uniref:molybdopterin molybdotransferase MoeA n=1 Tax=Sphingomonas sp. CARO-RG-8B-R24-01 TaxID=2914831 RepID=UPI001F5A94EC|nr:gephyrin-like molybdotransferase Glp [Sphingomonas sp. CARO-RG-8B-R24-01]